MLMTPPMASGPYLAVAAPRMISMRSIFSAPIRMASSLPPMYFDSLPMTGWPSMSISVCRGSAPRIATPTRPMASTVLVTPVSLKITSSKDLACFFSMSSFVIIVVLWLSYFASSLALLASTLTSLVVIVVSASAANIGIVSHVITAQASMVYVRLLCMGHLPFCIPDILIR